MTDNKNHEHPEKDIPTPQSTASGGKMSQKTPKVNVYKKPRKMREEGEERGRMEDSLRRKEEE